MFEPVSAVATTVFLGLSYPYALVEYAQPSSAVSLEAGLISSSAMDILRNQQGSQAFFGIKAALLSDLFSVISCLHVDEDQEPVTRRTLGNAEQFIRSLPNDLPSPAFSIDPDGEISVTWHVSRTRIFSVSISESERIAYAWMDGSDRGHAVDRFRAPALPIRLVSVLRMIVNNGSTTLRVA